MAADFAATQQRYAAEAAKRVRSDGLDQFQNAATSDSSRIRSLAADPWADHAALDAQIASGSFPLALDGSAKTKFLVTGAGMGGLITACRLVLEGFRPDQIRIVDPAGGLGGTWYWNRYPGLHCDVESYVYLPLLQESGFRPSQKYTSGVEIRNYLNFLVDKLGLRDSLAYRTTVSETAWDEEAKVWRSTLTTNQGSQGDEPTTYTVESEFVVLTSGLLARPQVPKLGGVGLEGFEGPLLHTARWDYSTTGGSPDEVFPELEKLRGKRVGVLGTGATAIQVVPILAQYVDELYVFQRTPSACYARNNRKTTDAEWDVITNNGAKDWHDARVLNHAMHMSNVAPEGVPDLVADEWSRQPAYSALIGDESFPDGVAPEKVPELIGHFLMKDAPYAAELRARIADVVKDPATAASLTPWYPVWCKRPTFSDSYLQAFNRPNVHLIDTAGKGVAAATPSGLVANVPVSSTGSEESFEQKEIPLDILVLATGYLSPQAGGSVGDPSARAGVKVLGRGGRTLREKFDKQGTTTQWGCMTNGFPNLFFQGPSQSAAASSQVHMLDVQTRQFVHVISEAHARVSAASTNGHTASKAEVKPVIESEIPAEEAWSGRCMAGATRLATTTVCTPSYINSEGAKPDMTNHEQLLKMARLSTWSKGIVDYTRVLEEWRREGGMKGISVS